MTYWRYVPFLLFLLLGGLLWRGLDLDPHQLPSTQLNHPLPPFSLPPVVTTDSPFTDLALRGQISLLNVWASWCENCQEEQALLVHLARNQSIAVFGLNYKDQVQDAQAWLAQYGNPYTHWGQDLDGRLAIELGVYGVPETFLIDSAGKIRYRHAGALTDSVWQREFLPRIAALESR
jgi:cytochrome c biogenesis protein CcmG/thiol:disulfide interchange protein DsbE